MHGNVAEWTADAYDAEFYKKAGASLSGAVQRRRRGAVPPRGARRFVGRRAGPPAQRGAALVRREVEPPRSAEPEEQVVAHRRDVRRLPRGPRSRVRPPTLKPVSLLVLFDGATRMSSHDDTLGASSRRDFLRTTTAAVVGGTLASTVNIPGAFAAGSDEIRVGVIGCGGRGTGAIGNVLAAAPGVRLVAVGDLFPDRLAESLEEPGEARGQGRSAQGTAVHRLGRVPEGDRQRRELRDPRLAARVQADAPAGRDRRRQARVHGEAGGRGRGGLQDGRRGGGSGAGRRAWASRPARSGATMPRTARP